MAETSIQKARRVARETREAREAETAAEIAAAAAAAEAKKPKPKEPSLLDRIRDAFSSEDDISRIDTAVDAVTSGVSQANKDSKRKNT